LTEPFYLSLSCQSSSQSRSQQRSNHPSSLANLAQTRNRDLDSILEELKKNLATRGVRGIVGLARKFRIMDDDNSGVLSMSEFKKGMRETSLELSEQVCPCHSGVAVNSTAIFSYAVGLSNSLLLL
jgi:hypothetical protein